MQKTDQGAYARYHEANLTRTAPKGWRAIRLVSDGLLIRSRVGTLAVWQGDRLVSTDPRLHGQG